MADISQAHLPDNNTYNIRDRVTHIELTQAQYDALVQTGQVDPDKVYFITDANPSCFSAENIDYDNTGSGLSATNIQDAIDEVKDDIPVNSNFSLAGLSDTEISDNPAGHLLYCHNGKWIDAKYYDYATSEPNSIGVNGTWQIPSSCLNHTFILVSVRRQGKGNSSLYRVEDLLARDNGLMFASSPTDYCTLTVSSTGLIKITALSNMADVFIMITGMF